MNLRQLLENSRASAREALALLTHPGIVTLYEFGQVQTGDGARLGSQTQPQHIAITGDVEDGRSAAVHRADIYALGVVFSSRWVASKQSIATRASPSRRLNLNP